MAVRWLEEFDQWPATPHGSPLHERLHGLWRHRFSRSGLLYRISEPPFPWILMLRGRSGDTVLMTRATMYMMSAWRWGAHIFDRPKWLGSSNVLPAVALTALCF